MQKLFQEMIHHECISLYISLMFLMTTIAVIHKLFQYQTEFLSGTNSSALQMIILL